MARLILNSSEEELAYHLVEDIYRGFYPTVLKDDHDNKAIIGYLRVPL